MSVAVQPGTGDDAAAFNAAFAALPNGGLVNLPGGTWQFKEGVIVPDNIIIQGEGRASFIGAAVGYTGGLLTLGQAATLRDVSILGPPFATGPCVYLPPDKGEQTIDGCRIMGGSENLRLWGWDYDIRNCVLGNAYGRSLIWVKQGGGGYMQRVKADHSPPGTPTNDWFNQTPWTANTNVPANYVVALGGFYLFTSAGGKTGATAPAIPAYAYDKGGVVQDGTIAWTLFAPTDYYSTIIDSGTFAWWEWGCDHSGPFVAGVFVTNTDGQPGPESVHISGADFGGHWQAGVLAEAGNDLSVSDSQIGSSAPSSSLNGRCGVYTRGNWKGDTKVNNCTVIGNDLGIYFMVGNGNVVCGNVFGGNTRASVWIGQVLDTTITGNSMRSTLWTAGGPIVIEPGADGYVVGGNTGGTQINDQANSPQHQISLNT